MGWSVALIGATGNIGSCLLQSLASQDQLQGCSFLVLSRSPEKQCKAFAKLPNLDRFSFISHPTDPASLEQALQGVETCFLCIPQMLVHEAVQYVDPIVKACVSAKVRHIVKVGTGVPEKYEYGRRHLAAEKLISDAGLHLTVVRAGALSSNPDFSGPAPPGAPYVLFDLFRTLSWLAALGLKPFRTMGSFASFFGDAHFPFTDNRDLADALCVILSDPSKHRGRGYDIISTASLTSKYVAAKYSSLLGRRIAVLDCGEEEQRMLVGMGGAKGEFVDILVEMFARFREGVFDYTSDDLRRLTGKAPRSFASFAEEQAARQLNPPPAWLLTAASVAIASTLALWAAGVVKR